MQELKVSNILSNLPLMFERNIGQHDEKVQFILHQNECTTFFTDTELVLSIKSNEEIQQVDELDNKAVLNMPLNNLNEYKINVLRISFENSNKVPQIIGKNEVNCKLNYFKGDNKLKWKCCIPLYEKLLYKEVYSGVDILYYEEKGNIKFDFIVGSNKEIENILLNFDGADKLEIDEDGNLEIVIEDRVLKLLKLQAYQDSNSIEGNFTIEDDYKVKFNIPYYDEGEKIIIKLLLLFETFKPSNVMDKGNSIAVDEKKCVYITGITSVSSFPEKRVYKNTVLGKDYSTFLIKIDTTKKGQSSLVYYSYIGGSGIDEGIAIDIDSDNVAYIVGSTNSVTGFPVTEKSYSYNYPGGDATGFLVKIDTTKVGLSSLVYGTYLGGNKCDYAYSVAVDKHKNVYIVGKTNSDDRFPITTNSYQTINIEGNDYGFLIKLDTTQKRKNALLYGTYFGGNRNDSFLSLAIDKNDYVYVTGSTQSTNFPITDNAYSDMFAEGLNNLFLSKFDTMKNGKEGLIYSSYFSGNGDDIGYGITVDTDQCAYIVGGTNSTEKFPITKEAIQFKKSNKRDSGFLIKVDTTLIGESSLIYGTYLGGDGIDVCSDIKIDYNKYVYITGYTSSKNFPLIKEIEESDLVDKKYYSFLLKLDTSKSYNSAVLCGTYFGENDCDFALSIAIDNSLNAYIVGYSDLIDSKAVEKNNRIYGESSIFLTKVSTKVCKIEVKKTDFKAFIDDENKNEYTIGIINNGPDIATNIIVTDILGKGVVVKGINVSKGGMNQVRSKLIWKINDLKPKEKVLATIVIISSIKNEGMENNLIVKTSDGVYEYKNNIDENKHMVV